MMLRAICRTQADLSIKFLYQAIYPFSQAFKTMSLLVSLLAIAGRIVSNTLLNTGEWQSQGTDSAFPVFNLVPFLILLLFALGITQYNRAT